MPVQIINGENKMSAGGIFLNGNTLEQIEEIVGKENITLEQLGVTPNWAKGAIVGNP